MALNWANVTKLASTLPGAYRALNNVISGGSGWGSLGGAGVAAAGALANMLGAPPSVSLGLQGVGTGIGLASAVPAGIAAASAPAGATVGAGLSGAASSFGAGATLMAAPYAVGSIMQAISQMQDAPSAQYASFGNRVGQTNFNTQDAYSNLAQRIAMAGSPQEINDAIAQARAQIATRVGPNSPSWQSWAGGQIGTAPGSMVGEGPGGGHNQGYGRPMPNYNPEPFVGGLQYERLAALQGLNPDMARATGLPVGSSDFGARVGGFNYGVNTTNQRIQADTLLQLMNEKQPDYGMNTWNSNPTWRPQNFLELQQGIPGIGRDEAFNMVLSRAQQAGVPIGGTGADTQRAMNPIQYNFEGSGGGM